MNEYAAGASGAEGYTYYLPLSLHSLTGDKLPPTEGGALHNSSILIVTEGKARIRLNATERLLARGSALCCGRGSRLEWADSTTLQGIAIEYKELTLDGRQPTAHALPEYPLNGAQAAVALAIELNAAWTDRRAHPLKPQRLLLELLELLFAAARATEKAANGAQWMADVIRLLDNRYHEEWSREAVAEYAGVSPEHVSRIFRKSVGRTFTEHISLLRIREAQRRLLTDSAANLDELAQQVGYKDGYYLSKKFKKITGLSPSIYTRKPRIIVSATYNYTEMLMTLGVRPALGAFAAWSRHRASAADHEDWELNWAEGRGSYERLQELQPDIIIGYDQLAGDRKLLAYGAVEAIPLFRLTWREQFRIVASIADRRKQAEELLEQYDRQVEQADKLLDKQGIKRGTAAIWEIYADAAYVFDSSYGRGAQVLYDDLRFQLPESLRLLGLGNRGYLPMPVHDVAKFDCDHLFIVEMTDSLAGSQLLRSSAWRGMRAVMNGNVYILNDFAGFYGFDPLSAIHQLSRLTTALTS